MAAVRLSLLLLATALWANAAEKPNFILIFADDLGYGDLGVYGSSKIRTPHLDRMATEGLRFTDFYATAPFCSPSRASLLTGRYPVRAGVHYVLFPTETTGLPQEETTLGELLRDEGYATAAIGKWHLGWPEPFRAHRHGFDLFYGLPYSNDMGKWTPEESLRAQHAFWELPLLENDKILEAPVEQTTLTHRYTEKAIDFITANRDRPFFLYFPHTFPHKPFYASERFEGRSPHGLYADTVEEVDWSVGQILASLRDLGIAERTMVVFTSDNGPARGGRTDARYGSGGSAGPLRGGKGSTFEGGMRVPGIFRWPGRIQPGTVTGHPASILDVFPTLAELAGASNPSDRVLDGRSIVGLLDGTDDSLGDHPFFYYFGVQLQAVRSGRWKLFLRQTELPPYSSSLWYMHNPELFERHHKLAPEPVLYDLETDIGETTDVSDEQPEVVARLSVLARDFDARMQREKRQPVYLAIEP